MKLLWDIINCCGWGGFGDSGGQVKHVKQRNYELMMQNAVRGARKSQHPQLSPGKWRVGIQGAKTQPIISATADFLFICIYYSVKRTTLVGNGNYQKNTSFPCYTSSYKFYSCTSELLQAQPRTEFSI